ncbi:PREDICTED: ubiquitin-conjugating enzyme E2 U, partial [Galeopterus variegatus]|uniref:Ubiquitin-conjugating enzyme E2 U n=1 Tax=Galeopterus variegatus TaxID=482537 RepID=A0ABM0SFS8_GALVR
VMLSNPVLENPVNLDAARILMSDESMYKLLVLKLCNGSLQLEDNSLQLTKDPHKFIKAIKVVSFNDYYKTWSGIATSKATEYYRTPLLEDPNFIGQYYKWKKMDLQYPKEWNLKYAAMKSRFARENRMPHKVTHSIKRIHLCPTLFPTTDEISPEQETAKDIVAKIYESEEEWESESSFYDDLSEPWEEEVESLVAWTSSLNMNTLEDEA